MQRTAHESAGTSERVCFVCCIESGLLEPMTVRMIDSLRRFGGRLGDSQVLAITPRLGPPISPATRRRLDELGADYVRVPLGSRFSWYHYLNKPVALARAEELTDASVIAFLDSDVLVLAEPDLLMLPPDVDFRACVSDVTLGATTGPDDPADAAWGAICDQVGIGLDDLPWVTTHLDHARIRLYFDSGIFSYRRETRLGRELRDLLTTVLMKKVRLPGTAWRVIEQVILAPLVIRNALRWDPLPLPYNHSMASYLPEFYSPERFREAKLLHYHDSMEPHFWETFLERLSAEHPKVAESVRPLGPVTNEAAAQWRAVTEVLRVERGIRRRMHQLRESPLALGSG